MSPALAGRLFATDPPGRPLNFKNITMDSACRCSAVAPPGAPWLDLVAEEFQWLPYKQWRVSGPCQCWHPWQFLAAVNGAAGHILLLWALCACIHRRIPSDQKHRVFGGGVYTFLQIFLLSEMVPFCVKGLVAYPQAQIEVKPHLCCHMSS